MPRTIRQNKKLNRISLFAVLYFVFNFISNFIYTLVLVSIFIVASSDSAFAADNRKTVYHGRIVKPDGTALSGAVAFTLQITDSSGSCVLWEETQNATITDGIFNLTLGSGTNVFDGSGNSGTLFASPIFRQSVAINCKGGTPSASVTPNSNDDRNLNVTFNDGTGVQTLSQQIPIKSVPYSLYAASASNADKMAGYAVSTTAPATGQVLTFNGTSWAPANAAATGVISVTSANSDIGVATSTTTPVLTLNSGTGANQIVKLNGSSQLPAVDGSQLTSLNASQLASGYVSIARGGTGLSTSGAANQVLGMNNAASGMEYKTITAGTGITVTHGVGSVTIAATNAGTVTSVTAAATAGNPIIIGGTASAPTVDIAAASSSANGYLKSTDWATFNSKQAAGNYITTLTGDVTSSSFASGSVSTTVAAIRGIAVSATTPSSSQVLRYDGSSWVPDNIRLSELKNSVGGSAFNVGACNANQTVTWSSLTDTMTCQNIGGLSLTTQVTGVLPIANGGTNASTSAAALTNLGAVAKAGDTMTGNLTFNANIGNTYTAGSGSNTITLQGPSGAIGTSFTLRLPTADGTSGQVLKTDGAGNLSWISPSTGSVTSVTGALPITIGGTAQAPVVGITAATISASGAVQLAQSTDTAANLVVQANDTRLTDARTPVGTTLTSGNLWVGNASNQAAAVSMSGDATISNAGAITVAKINGVALGTTTATAGNLLIGSGTQWVSNAISGDATLSSTGALALATTSVTAGTYGNTVTIPTFTVDSKGRLTAAASATIPTANGSTTGLLSSTDWTTFNNKGTVASVTSANSDISVSASTTAPVLTLNSGTGANQIVKLNGSSQLPAVDGSQLTSLNASNLASGYVSIARGGTSASTSAAALTNLGAVAKAGDTMTGNLTFSANIGNTYTAGAGSNTITLQGPSGAIGTSFTLRLPTADGTSGQVLKTDGAGNLSWVSPSVGSVTSVTGTSPITIGGTAQAPVVGITAATISASGVVQLAQSTDTAANLVVQANDTRLTDARAPTGSASGDLTGTYPNPTLAAVGTAGTYYKVTTDSKGRVTSGASSLVAADLPNAAGDVSGAYSALSVDKIKGTAVSATAPTTSGQVFRYNGASWVPNFISMADLRSTVTGASALTSCSASQTLTWSSATDNLACSNISISAATQITGVLPIANGGTSSSAALNNNRIMVSSGGKIVESGALTDGQILIGATGGAPTAANLTAGTGITITNAANGVTITATNSGAVTSVTGALPITIGGTAQAPVVGITAATISASGAVQLAQSSDTAANLVVQANDTRLTDARTPVGTTLTSGNLWVGNASNQAAAVSMSGDATISNAGAITVAKINGVALGTTTATAGNLLIGSGTQWVSNAISGDATLSSTGALALATTSVTAGTYGNTTTIPTFTVDSKGRLTAAASATIPTANGSTTGLLSSTDWTTFNNKGTVASVTSANSDISVSASTTAPVLTLNSGTGANQIVKLNGSSQLPAVDGSQLTSLNASQLASGYVSIARGGTSASTSAAALTNLGAVAKVGDTMTGHLTFSATKGSVYTDNSSSGTVTLIGPNSAITSNFTLRLPTADGSANQVLKTDGAGNLGWATDGGGTVTSVTASSPLSVTNGTSTPNITISQSTSTTSGYLSSTDWTTFNNKQSTTLATDKIWIGNASSVATAVSVSKDVSVVYTSGTSSADYTVKGIRGIAVSATTPSSSQVLRYDGSSWVPDYIRLSELKNSVGGSAFNVGACNANQTVTWSSLTDTMTCQNIGSLSLTTQVTGVLPIANGGTNASTSATALTNLGAVNIAGDTMTGTLNLPASGLVVGTNQLIVKNGNVGIGTASPIRTLEVSSTTGLPFSIYRPANTAGWGVQQDFALNNSSSTRVAYATINGGITTNTAGAEDGVLVLSTIKAGTMTEQMRVTSSGNIGIGTNNPSQILDVEASTALSYLKSTTGTNRVGYWANNTGGNYIVGAESSAGGSIFTSTLPYAAVFGTDGANALQLATNNAARFTILSGGNVGVGTTSPSKKLHVLSSGYDAIFESSSGGAGIQIKNNDASGKTWGIADNAFSAGVLSIGNATDYSTDSTKWLHLSASGNVGIGTTAPNKKLDIVGSATGSSAAALGVVNSITMNGGGNTYGEGFYSLLNIDTATYTNNVNTSIASDNRVYVNGSGVMDDVVGVAAVVGTSGGTATINNLAAFSSIPQKAAGTTITNYRGLWLRDATGIATNTYGIYQDGSTVKNYFAGNVGIGITAPATKLHVWDQLSTADTNRNLLVVSDRYNAGVNGSDLALTALTSGGNYAGWNFSSDWGGRLSFGVTTGSAYTTTPNEYLTIASGGNVGIGTTNPGYKLDVQGGNVNSAGAYTNVSDIRLKQDIQPLENSLEKVLQLRSVSYYWKDQSFDSSKQVGFIAQEVEKVFPEVVKTDSKGFKAMSYSQLVSPIVDAIKELYAKFMGHDQAIATQAREIASVKAEKADKAELEAKTAKLESENAQLKQENAAIKARLDRIEKSLRSK